MNRNPSQTLTIILLIFMLLLQPSVISATGVIEFNQSNDGENPPAGEQTPPNTIYLPSISGARPAVQEAIGPEVESIGTATLGVDEEIDLSEKAQSSLDEAINDQAAPAPGMEPSLAGDSTDKITVEDELLAPAAVDGWTTIMSQGFEGAFPASGWRVFDNNGTTNGEYYWDDVSYKAQSGSWSAWAARAGANGLNPANYNYPNNMRSWMIYGPFSLSDATDATLSFGYWNQSESGYDYFKWLASTNGTNFYGYQTSGNSNGWQNKTFDLKSVPTLGNLTGKSSVWIAFYFITDGSVTAKGPFVDNVLLRKNVTSISCPNQYKAEYFNNRALSGGPVVTRCENWPINYNWGSGSPVSGVGSNNFSVRWTGTAYFSAGTYVFAARADDGIRVFLDNNQIVTGWVDQPPTSHWSVNSVSAGQHTVKVEYYENGGGALAEFRWFMQPDVSAARNQLKTMTNMTNPWRQVTAPIQNTANQRQSVIYSSAIEQFEVTWQEFSGRYQPSSQVRDTRCNIYAGDVMRAMGSPLPTKGELGVGASGSQWTDPMTANARNLNEFLNGQRTSTNPANSGWRKIDPTTADGLKQLLNHLRDGRPAVASNVEHIAVLLSEQPGVTRWQDLRIAQAGARNFMNDRLEVGFGVGKQPQFFIRD